jgi:hypothetical protein
MQFSNWQLSHLQSFESFDWGSYKGKCVPYFISKPLHCCCQAFTMVPHKHLNHGWDIVQIQFCVHSNWTAKCEKCDKGLCILWCFKGQHWQHLVRWSRGEACTHIKQITTKNICTMNFTMFKNKYLGLCGPSNSSMCTCFHWQCLNAQSTQICVCFNHTFQCKDMCTLAAIG